MNVPSFYWLTVSNRRTSPCSPSKFFCSTKCLWFLNVNYFCDSPKFLTNHSSVSKYFLANCKRKALSVPPYFVMITSKLKSVISLISGLTCNVNFSSPPTNSEVNDKKFCAISGTQLLAFTATSEAIK